MATRYSPKIVTDGLVMCLDAGAVRSYPGAGPQLVVNGDFASDITTGWEVGHGVGEGTVSHDTGGDGGRLKVVGSVTGRLNSSAAITLVVGQKYRFSVSVSGGNSNHFVHCASSKGGNGNPVTNFTLGGGDGTYVHDFVATATTFYMQLGATGGSTQYYDQVSLVAIASNLSLPGDSGYSSGVSYGVPGANQWSDLSGNSNNGVLNNMQYDLEAESGAGGTRSFDFDGTSDYISIGNDSSLNFGSAGNFTLEAVVKLNTADDNEMIVGKQNGHFGQGYAIRIEESGSSNDWGVQLHAEQSDGTMYRYISTQSIKQDFTHIIAVFDRSSAAATLYLNGANGITGTTLSANLSALGDLDVSQDFTIGGDSDGNYNIDGKIVIVRVYNKALTSTEAKQNFRATKGRFGL